MINFDGFKNTAIYRPIVGKKENPTEFSLSYYGWKIYKRGPWPFPDDMPPYELLNDKQRTQFNKKLEKWKTYKCEYIALERTFKNISVSLALDSLWPELKKELEENCANYAPAITIPERYIKYCFVVSSIL